MLSIQLTKVEKTLGKKRVLHGITCNLRAGATGIVGPNGAGKTTLLKILLGVYTVDAGSVVVAKGDDRVQGDLRSRIGYLAQGDQSFLEFSGLDYVRFACELFGHKSAHATARAHHLMTYVGLGDARYRRLKTYSFGMLQRARLAQALAGDPQLLLLDEPTTGLDTAARAELIELLRNVMQKTQSTLILCSHELSDIEMLCDDILVLSEGQIVYHGATEELIERADNRYLLRAEGDLSALETALHNEGYSVVSSSQLLGTRGFQIRIPSHQRLEDVLRILHQTKCEVRELVPLVQTLEEAFHRSVQKHTATVSDRA